MANLSAELELEKGITTRLAEDVNLERDTTRQLRTNLEQNRTATVQMADELRLEREHSRKANSQLDLERQRGNQLAGDNTRLRASQTVNFRGSPTPIRIAVEETITTVNARIAKTAVANVTSMPAEGIPIYGIAIIVAATAFEVDMACRTMDDFYQLQIALEPELAVPLDRNEVCGIVVPTVEQIWTEIRLSPSVAWNASVDGLAKASDSVRNLKTPDFGVVWQRIVQSFDHWF